MSKGFNPVDEEGNQMFYEVGGAFTFGVAIPLFYLLLIYVAHLWTIHVGPRCETIVSWLSRKAFGDDSDSESTKESSSNGILTT